MTKKDVKETKEGVLLLKDVVSAQRPLEKLSKINLPIKVAYQISKVLKKAGEEVKFYEIERFNLIKKHGRLTDKATDSYQVRPEKNKAFQEELKKLEEIEVNTLVEKKIKLEDLGDINVAPETLVDWLFE